MKSLNIWKQGQDKIPLECCSFAWPSILGNKRRNLTLFSSCSVFRNLFFWVTFSLLLIDIIYARFINNNDNISSKNTFSVFKYPFFPHCSLHSKFILTALSFHFVCDILWNKSVEKFRLHLWIINSQDKIPVSVQ